MKSFNPLIPLLFSVLIFLPGCDLIGDIFEAGFWAAILIIIAIIALIIWLLFSFSQSYRNNEL